MENRKYLIAYDISDARRRRQDVKCLEDFGYRVQYSVFEMDGPESEKEKMMKRLLYFIDEEEDSLLVYEFDVPSWEKRKIYGKNKEMIEKYDDMYMIL